MAFKSIVELMRVSPSARKIDWLRDALTNAVQLELATLPPYLCIYWSIKDKSMAAAQLIQSIFMQEMAHMGLAANMLVGVGGTPQIFAARPTYPGRLPGGVRPELTVDLACLSTDYLRDVCMEIEMPERPLARAVEGEDTETFPTIGAFYDAIIQAFEDVQPHMDTTRQVDAGLGVSMIRNVGEAIEAVNLIKLEGEGTTESPDEASDIPAHYYKFGSILHGKTIVKKGGQWVWEGSDVPFPEVWPMSRLPEKGWSSLAKIPPSAHDLLETFNGHYKDTLTHLQSAWTGDQAKMEDAVDSMRALEQPAVELMKIPIGGRQLDGSQNYGPDFRV